MDVSSEYAALCRRRLFLFSVLWLLGLVTGTLLAAKADPSFLSLMPGAVDSRSSIIPVLLTAALPFGIAAYAAMIDRYIFLFITAFVKAVVLAVCAGVVVRSFGSAGWLIQPMWQFTDLVSGMVFCWFCFHCISGKSSLKRDMILSLLLCALAAILDYLLVSPFLEALI